MYIVLIVLIFVFYQIVKYLTYWKRNGVPQLSIAKIFQENFKMCFKTPSQTEILRNYCQLFSNQRYFGVYQVFQKYLVVHDPDLVKQITVKDFNHFTDHAVFGKKEEPLWGRNVFALEGEEWKKMRTTLDATYTSAKIKIMFNSLQKCCEQFLNYLEEQPEQQLRSGIDIKNVFGFFATNVIATSVFGYSSDSLKIGDNDFYVNSQLLFPVYDTLERFRRFLLFNVPTIASYFGARFYAKGGSDYLLEVTTKNVEEREKNKIKNVDVIQTLLAAKEKGMNLNNIDMAAQTTIFFFAGFDTVGSSLCFATYEIASNIDVQRRLQKEVDQVLKECQGSVTYYALQEMKYMDMVVSEVLRKWPPVLLDRKCSKPYVIQPKNDGETPVHLKKGDIIWIPIRDMQRNPNLFPNPEKFDPERFNNENKANINPYAYGPFGIGPRGCVGKRFGLMEIKLLLFYILSKFDIDIVDKTVDPMQFGNLAALTIAIHEYWLGLRRRKNVR